MHIPTVISISFFLVLAQLVNEECPLHREGLLCYEIVGSTVARTIAVAVEQRIIPNNWSREQQRIIMQGIWDYGSRPTLILQMLAVERDSTSSCNYDHLRHNLRWLTVEIAMKTGKLHILPHQNPAWD